MLDVRDEIGVERVAELARGGVALGCGDLVDPADVRLLAPGGAARLLQTRVLERWPDGSIRWLGVAFLADVPRQGVTSYALAPGAARAEPGGPRASAVAGPEGVAIDTGAVSFLVRQRPFNALHGFPGIADFELTTRSADGAEHRVAAEPDVRLEVLDAGPIVVRVLATGSYRAADAATLLDFELELEAVAGSDEVTLECRLVNREPAPSTRLGAWTARLVCESAQAACCGVFDAVHRTRSPFALRQGGEGHARGIFVVSRIESDADDWEDVSEPGYRDRWEWAELSGLHAKGWIDVELAGGNRLTVAVPRFFDDNPSALEYDGDAIEVALWPADAGPLELTQGVASTRRVALRVHRGAPVEASRFAERAASRLVVDAERQAFAVGAAPDVLPRRASRYPALESHIREELFSWCLVGQATGFLDRGDCHQVAAGPRAGFSANNEHDAILALCLHYLRSGERAYLDSAISYADHVVDVDVIHASTRNEFEVHGVRAHGRCHVHYVPARTADGSVETSVDTGHMWVEGLLLLGAITCTPRYVDAARGIGDCLLRLEEIGWTRPEPGPRNSGWPLVALAALYRSTGDDAYLAAARRVAAHAVEVQGADGRWTMRLGFWDGYCAWQNCVLLTGLARLLEVDPEPAAAVDSAFRAGAEALLQLGRYDDGGFVYLDQSDYRWVSRTGMIRETLAAAYELTGDERFLVAGLEGGARWYRPAGSPPATSNDVAEWRGHLVYLAALERAGLLRDLASTGMRSPSV